MKITANKCEHCGVVIVNDDSYGKHLATCVIADQLKTTFGITNLANGKFVQRDKAWYGHYKNAVLEAVATLGYDYPPLSYGWWRCLSDSNSALYGPALVLRETCQKCWKQHDQQFHATHCNCQS